MASEVRSVTFFIAAAAAVVVATALERAVPAPPPGAAAAAPPPAAGGWPVLVPLRRESVPIRRQNRTVSHRTSYSGLVSLGAPAQDFRVVFDTGSGQVVVPSSACASETCLAHRRYSLPESRTGAAINADGAPVPPGELCDQVTIGYGTGTVTGEFVRDRLCIGAGSEAQGAFCMEVNVVVAVEMTANPFKSFQFDGIFGLGLDALSVSPEFNFFKRLGGMHTGAALQFGVFLNDREEDSAQGSEIALGGYNRDRLLTELRWAPAVKTELGYWQVKILAVRIGNRTLDACRDGTCRGVVDTGTSHLGVPGPYVQDMQRSLTVDGTGREDCRGAPAPTVELVLEGLTLSLPPEHYMRPLALPASMTAAGGGGGPAPLASPTASLPGSGGGAEEPTLCTPRLMPVNLPAPLGPNLFLLGEPVLHKYYTVYDWQEKQVGFGLSASATNTRLLLREGEGGREGPEHGEEGDEEEAGASVILMQVTLTLSTVWRA